MGDFMLLFNMGKSIRSELPASITAISILCYYILLLYYLFFFFSFTILNFASLNICPEHSRTAFLPVKANTLVAEF